ncbi:MAG: S9 family peptidase, partial [Syntrophothermus sp.]
MKRFYMLSIFLAVFLHVTFSQVRMLTLEESVTRGYYSLSPKRLQQTGWRPGTDEAVFADRQNGKEVLYSMKAGGNVPAELLTLDRLNKSLPENTKPLMRFSAITWIDADNFRFMIGPDIFVYNIKTGKAEIKNSLHKEASHVDAAPKGIFTAYTVDNNLFISTGVNQSVQISHDSNKDIVNGEAAHRNEFGITKGTFWSPGGNKLAYSRMDQTMVTDYPLVDINERPAKLKNIKYPMAGMNSHEVTVGVYDVKKEKLVWLQTGEPKDQYLTNIAWTPDEKYILIAHLNRDQNHMRLIKYDAETGSQLGVLFEEKDEKYVEPLNPPVFMNNASDKFLWFSRRDGWNHLYLYDLNGKLISQVTKGEWEVTDLNGIDKKGENIFFTSTMDGVLDRHLYRVNLKSGKIEKLTSEPGTHNAIMNEEGTYFIDTYSSLKLPRFSGIFSAKGKPAGKLLEAENPLKEFKLGETKLFAVKGKDNSDLYSMIILPPDFDSTKKYPVLVYVYGGPHSQLVTNTWLGGANLWLNYMAQQGYIVFTLDNRGTSNRGKSFEQATFRHLGAAEIEDQTSGVNYLKSLPYVDGSRIGVFGWSYGGFMATSLMTRTGGLFKVGVAGGPVIDWSYYEVMYGERYMDT